MEEKKIPIVNIDFIEDDLTRTLCRTFRDGKSVLIIGDRGEGKSFTGISIMEELLKVQNIFCITNIKFRKGHNKLFYTTRASGLLRIACQIRKDYFDNWSDREKAIYIGGKLPPGAPLIIVILDEAEGFLSKFRSTEGGAYQFGELFLPLIRKLGLSLALIYHEEDGSISALRDTGRGLFGTIEKISRSTAIVKLRGFKRLRITDIQLPKIITPDSWTWGSFQWDVDMKALRDLVSDEFSEEIPNLILRMLDKNENPQNAFPISDWADFGAGVYLLAQKMNVKGFSEEKISLALNTSRGKLRERRKKLIEIEYLKKDPSEEAPG